jgi:hypothetical protein
LRDLQFFALFELGALGALLGATNDGKHDRRQNGGLFRTHVRMTPDE